MPDTTNAIDFGTWKPHVDERLFEHLPHDGRTAMTLHSDIIARNADGKICAKETAIQARKKIQERFGKKIDPNMIRWHKSTEFKKATGKSAKHLATFIHQHL